MASEDHDFEEVNNFNLFGKKIKWDSSQTGAVGNLKRKNLKPFSSNLPKFRENRV